MKENRETERETERRIYRESKIESCNAVLHIDAKTGSDPVDNYFVSMGRNHVVICRPKYKGHVVVCRPKYEGHVVGISRGCRNRKSCC